MRSSIRPRIILIVIALLLSGCAGKSADFTDDFSDPSSGWLGGTAENYARGYVGGRYVFQIFEPDWFVWSTHGQSYEDVIVEVTTTAEGQRDNHYGLVCRAKGDEFYYFAISADGYYGIYRRQDDGTLLSLIGDSMQRSNAVRSDESSNNLTVSCVETTLSLFINGIEVAEVTDDTLKKGNVGMAAGTLSSNGSNVWFDDIAVRVP